VVGDPYKKHLKMQLGCFQNDLIKGGEVKDSREGGGAAGSPVMAVVNL